MITNNSITYFHKTLNNQRLEQWAKTYYEDVWLFKTKGGNANEGYERQNTFNVRIPIEEVSDYNFSIGDIVVVGQCENIETQADLEGKEYFNVLSVNVNDFGNNPHIHLGGA